MSIGTLALVGAAGSLGVVARYLVDTTVMRRVPIAVPFGTFTVNLSAAVLLGLLTGLAASTTTTLIAGTGFIGGYSTFSTWMLETHRLTEDNEPRWAILNLAVSGIVGVAAVLLGRTIGAAL